MGHTFPYDLHGIDVATLLAPGRTGNIRVVRAKKNDVDQLRAAYDSLLPEVLSCTHCASFACGGIVFLNYAVSIFCRHCWGHSRVNDINQVKTCQDRFHLLPSTTWQVSDGSATTNCRTELVNWLAAIQSAPHVLLVDTSFSDGGINNIRRTVTDIPRNHPIPKDILLCGVIDLGRYGARPLPQDEVVFLPGGGRLRIRFIGVPNLVSEDIVELLGYSRCKLHASLMPEWPETTLILNIDDDNAISFSTCTAAAVFSDLLVDWKHRIGKASTFPTAGLDKNKFVTDVKKLRAALWATKAISVHPPSAAGEPKSMLVVVSKECDSNCAAGGSTTINNSMRGVRQEK